MLIIITRVKCEIEEICTKKLAPSVRIIGNKTSVIYIQDTDEI